MKKIKDSIEHLIEDKSVELLKIMLKRRRAFLECNNHMLKEEYLALKTTADMIEHELFIRGVCDE